MRGRAGGRRTGNIDRGLASTRDVTDGRHWTERAGKEIRRQEVEQGEKTGDERSDVHYSWKLGRRRSRRSSSSNMPCAAAGAVSKTAALMLFVANLLA